MKTDSLKKATTLIAGILALNFAAPVQASIFGPEEVKRWNMCDSRDMPEDALQRIMQRSDFEEILRRMFENCPEAALWLTDQPTASISDGRGIADKLGRENDTGRPDTGPENDPEPEAPEAPDAPDPGLPG